jgi:hypothetical protein
MSDILEITRKAPENKSMNYEFLRQEGIKYIQELSSRIWTDYNSHDPGITILEALCYAITDLGNRASYPIGDIIATEGENYGNEDKIKNFYKAEQILPNAPLTINDYRKLLMDIQIEADIPGSENKEYVGVKNAWIKKSSEAEQKFYLHKKESIISYEKDPEYSGKEEQKPLQAGNLYNVLLEFSQSTYFDDLNHNTIDGYLTIYDNPADTNLEGLIIGIDLTLPRWDTEDTDWDDLNDIKANINKIKISFSNLPNNYAITSQVDENFDITLKGTVTSSGSVDELTNLSSITKKINSFLCDETNEESLVYAYQQKIYIIQQIIDEVEKTLNANRNLCDDFLKPGALKIEEIGICADLQVEPDSDIEKLLAQVYYQIGKFLSPTVNFYSLSEMLNLCVSQNSYLVTQINKDDGYFTVDKDLTEILEEGDTVTIKNSISNSADYTVVSVEKNVLNEKYSNVYVDEDIASDVLTEDETLNFNVRDKENCLSVDQIFEGPLLKHGFIENNELEDSELMEVIHVSDLIQIIMDIPGIIAVKNLEIASYPEDPTYDTELKSVKWFLDLAYDKNYVPRLSVDKSTVVFFKDQLPYKANKKEVEEMVNALIAAERPQKLTPPVTYPQVPKGTYRDLEEYTSIQEDFPLHYGIGYAGIPGLANLTDGEQTKKIAQTRQLKGYLMFFDQLLANYLSQLANVKFLFSMNAGKNELGEYEIGRTYYTQALFSSVSDSDPLYINKEGHEAELKLIAENESLFNTRRNKFLDHLLARFAESFTDYAMMITRLSGNKAPRELIDDKLNFLNQYPEISSNRGLAFNYMDSCNFWHIDNKSGLEKRSSLLMGIPEKKAEDLVFTGDFKITPSGDLFSISIMDGSNTLLVGIEEYATEEKAREILENILILAIQEEKYEIISPDNTNYSFQLICGEEIIATSYKTNYSSTGNAWTDIELLVTICEDEFFHNQESNRNNIAPPIDNYFEVNYSLVTAEENYYLVDIDLYRTAFEFTEENKLLSSSYKIPEAEADSEEDIRKNAREFIWKIIMLGTQQGYYIFNFSDDPDPDYVFQVTDRNSTILATSSETNFNDKLATYISNLNAPVVKISGSTGNDGYYVIGSCEPDGPNVIINIPVTSPVPSTTTDGNLSLAESYACEIHSGEKYIQINQDITSKLKENDVLVLIHEGSETGFYTVQSVSYKDGHTQIDTNEPLPLETNLSLIIYPSFAYSLDEENKTFSIDEDIRSLYYAGDTLAMWEENNLIQVFTIKSTERYSNKTQITVSEKINEDPRGRITFTKIYQQVRIENPATSTEGHNAFTIKGGEDTKAVQEMIAFLKTKFTETEGLHLIEHVILRPKNNNNILLLSGDLAIYGNLLYEISAPLIIIDPESEIIGVQGDITPAIYEDPGTGIITVKAGGFTFELHAENIEYSVPENATIFDLTGIFPGGLTGSEETVQLTYTSSVTIDGIEEESQKILLPSTSEHVFTKNETVSIAGSEEEINDGTYTIELVEEDGVVIHLEKIQDKLLPVFLSDDCSSYGLSNPYTSIATVVLPYWPERFNNMDFRNFFEKTLRLEAPSHVLLKICWVNPVHMEDFEREYKEWLLINNCSTATEQEISEALSLLIDAIDQLRNVYPVGTLYDPEEHETLKNTIILDNTMLGSF